MRSSARGSDFWVEFLTIDSWTHVVRLALVLALGLAVGSAWDNADALEGQARWYLNHCQIHVTGMAVGEDAAKTQSVPKPRP